MFILGFLRSSWHFNYKQCDRSFTFVKAMRCQEMWKFHLLPMQSVASGHTMSFNQWQWRMRPAQTGFKWWRHSNCCWEPRCGASRNTEQFLLEGYVRITSLVLVCKIITHSRIYNSTRHVWSLTYLVTDSCETWKVPAWRIPILHSMNQTTLTDELGNSIQTASGKPKYQLGIKFETNLRVWYCL